MSTEMLELTDNALDQVAGGAGSHRDVDVTVEGAATLIGGLMAMFVPGGAVVGTVGAIAGEYLADRKMTAGGVPN
jgi:uncharacterized protein YqgC (DUF456 family)